MLNKYGFDKKETLTNLINKNGLVKTKTGLEKNGRVVFVFPKGGLSSRLKATWEFFKGADSVETLAEYASRIGAELKPTCLADMPVVKKTDVDGNSFFAGLGWVTTWLQVKDPDGGLNKSGMWPASVQMLGDGSLVVATS
jgi:hypothetical protein